MSAESFELLGSRNARRVALLGDTNRAELGSVNLIDQPAGSEDDLGAAAADVGDGHFAAGDVERPLHAQEGEPGLFLGRDHVDFQIELVADAAAKLGTVLGVADGAGGDGGNPADAVTGGDRAEAAQGVDGGFDGGC